MNVHNKRAECVMSNHEYNNTNVQHKEKCYLCLEDDEARRLRRELGDLELRELEFEEL